MFRIKTKMSNWAKEILPDWRMNCGYLKCHSFVVPLMPRASLLTHGHMVEYLRLFLLESEVGHLPVC